MKKFMNIINEGIDPRQNHPAFAGDDAVADRDDDMIGFEEMLNNIIGGTVKNLQNRMSIEDVYYLVKDGIPFEDAVHHIAGRDGFEPAALRSLVVDDYKVLRGNPDLYATDFGHSLVSKLNPAIHESFRRVVEAHDATLLEGSFKVGAYTNKSGGRVIVHRAEHDPKHHMVINDKGQVMTSIHGDALAVHDQLTKDGFQGVMRDETKEK